MAQQESRGSEVKIGAIGGLVGDSHRSLPFETGTVNNEAKGSIDTFVETTVEAAEIAVKQPLFKGLARFGFLTKGFLFVVIGALALLLILGIRGGRITDPRGALATVAAGWYGTSILLLFVAGALAHYLWNILRGITDVDNLGTKWKAVVMRAISVGLGLFYIGLALSALEIVTAVRLSRDSSQAEETFVAFLLLIPILGATLVGVIGLGLIVAGVNECYSGLSGKYRENYRTWKISRSHAAVIVILGILSFTARSLLLGVLGFYFIWAAFFGTPGEGIGLDVSLLSLLQSNYGTELGLFTAVGLICHGVLAFFEARYRRIC